MGRVHGGEHEKHMPEEVKSARSKRASPDKVHVWKPAAVAAFELYPSDSPGLWCTCSGSSDDEEGASVRFS